MLTFYHPTTVFVVDDEPLFLKSFEYGFGDQFLCHLERNAEQALQTLTGSMSNVHGETVHLRPFMGQIDDIAMQGQNLMKVRASDVARALEDDRRFAAVSVIIIDYVMPSMNGIDFCRKISNLPAKKVLLTGRASDGTAVEAFNEGLIDRFLVKHDSEISTKLPEIIRHLQLQFFEDAGRRWNGFGFVQPSSFVEQALVVGAIKKLLKQHRACEYYVCSEPNGVVFVNEDGETGFIAVVDNDDRRAHREIAEVSDAPDALMAELRRDEVVALFPSKLGYFERSCHTNWYRYLHLAEVIDTPLGRWSLSVLRGENLAELLPQKVPGMTQYRSSIDHPAA